MNRSLKISIITAVYNRDDTIICALNSVSNQTYKNIEHIIIDGGSIDDTLGLLRSNINENIIFISEKDNGIYDALNKGIHLATGDIIGFLHADDFYASNEVLLKIAKAFQSPSVCAVYGDLDYVSQSDAGKIIRRWKSTPFNQRDLDWGWMPPHPTLYVRREWYERIGGFDINFRIAADYLSILKLFSQSDFKAVYLPEVFVKMRLGGASNKSLKAVIRKTNEDWLALRRSHFSIFETLRAIACKNLRKVGQFF